MLAAVFMALAFPLAAIISFALGNYKLRQQAANPESASADAGVPLQKSLEDIAGRTLAPQSLNDSTVEIVADNPAAKVIEITKLAEAFGGSAMAVSTEGAEKLWTQIPGDRVEIFKGACAKGLKEGMAPVPGQAEKVMIEVVIKKPRTP